MEMTKEVLREIETMRYEMHTLIEADDQMKNPQILWASQKIDVLLMRYHELVHKRG